MGTSTKSITKAGWVLYRGGDVKTANRSASLGRKTKNTKQSCGRGRVLVDSYPQRSMNLPFQRSKSSYICVDKKNIIPLRSGLKIIYSKFTSSIVVSGRKSGTIVSGVCRKQTLFPTPGLSIRIVAAGRKPARTPKSSAKRKGSVPLAAKQMGIDKMLVPVKLEGKRYASKKFDCAPLLQIDLPAPKKKTTRKP